MRNKRVIWGALAAITAALLLVLAGCGGKGPTRDEPFTLRLLSNADPADTYGMNYEIKRLIKEYEANHENVTIELESMPASGEERETWLEQLRTEIMAGQGPDLYLMTPYRTEQVGYNASQTVLDGGLFPDVEQVMYNGLFCDVSALYDADDELDTVGLVTGVMDAGVVDGARYMLPLRYTYPVVYADTERLEQSGMDVETMKSSWTGFYNELLEHGDTPWFNGASAVSMYSLNPLCRFPDLIDYKGGRVLLTAGELAEYTRQCWELLSRGERIANGVPSVGMYVWQGGWFPLSVPELEDGGEDPWALMRAPLVVNSFSNVANVAAIAQAEGVELEMFPLRCADGSLIAEITWWGAVGAGSEHPEAAYDFLRLLLLPESQWELKRPLGNEHNPVYGLLGAGWPVRAAGSIEPLWAELTTQLDNIDTKDQGERSRIQALHGVALTDDDILALLTAEIDRARVPMLEGADWSLVLLNRDNYAENMEAMAQETIDALRWHIAEG